MDNLTAKSPPQTVSKLFGRIRTSNIVRHFLRVEDSVEIKSSPLGSRAAESGVLPQRLLDRFLNLPPELQLDILSYLDYGEILRLQQTCTLFRENITLDVKSLLFRDVEDESLRTCYLCLTQKDSTWIVLGNSEHPKYPLTSKCFECIQRRSSFMVGMRYTLVNKKEVFVCRWCGIPVTRPNGRTSPEFHLFCYTRLTRMFWLHYVYALLQWIAVIIGLTLCLRFGKSRIMVIIPLALSLVMALWSTILNFIRNKVMRTYHWSLAAEIVILILWIIPMTEIIDIEIVHGYLQLSLSNTIAILVFITINMIFRILNILGFMILLCEWKMWQRRKSGASLLKLAAGKVMMVLVAFADPNSVEQDYPGTWWFKRRRSADIV